MEDSEIYDMIIIGSGFAGCAAAIYGGMANLRCLMIAGDMPGGLITTTQWVDNYPATPGITGPKLADDMIAHAGQHSRILYSKVIKIELGQPFALDCTDGNRYYARTIIVCTGSYPRKLPQLEGDVNYCAICDGYLYKGKDVAVVGGGNSALEAVHYLSEICSKIYLVHRRDTFRALASIVEKVERLPNVEILRNQEPRSYKVEASAVPHERKMNTLELSSKNVDVDGVFVCVGYLPNTDFLTGLIALDEAGYVIVNQHLQTSRPGIYAAGDVVSKPYKQGVIAAADGTIAALSAAEYLRQQK